MPIHSTGVPNARMTLPPLAVTAYRSSPSSSGVRAPWVNLPVSPSGMPLARVSAFIAWIVSATFACCTSSLNHRSPWCSSPCIMVSTWGGPRRKCSPSCLVSGLIPAVDDLHLCETAVHEQLRSGDIPGGCVGETWAHRVHGGHWRRHTEAASRHRGHGLPRTRGQRDSHSDRQRRPLTASTRTTACRPPECTCRSSDEMVELAEPRSPVVNVHVHRLHVTAAAAEGDAS